MGGNQASKPTDKRHADTTYNRLKYALGLRPLTAEDRADNSKEFERILGEKSIEGPSLASMLLPKHDDQLPPQSKTDVIKPDNKHKNGLSPQFKNHGINFGEQLKHYFSQHKMTDSSGNFRPGERLPPKFTPDYNKKTKLASQHNEKLPPQDSEYVTADTNKDDSFSKTGFVESFANDEGNRPFRGDSRFAPSWNPYEVFAMMAKNNIAFTSDQQQKIWSLLKSNQMGPSRWDSSGFKDTASLIDGHDNQMEPGFRPGERENLYGRDEFPWYPQSGLRRSEYPDPRRYGWNYFTYKRREAEKREELKRRKEEQRIEHNFNLPRYPDPSPLKFKNGSIIKPTKKAAPPVTPAMKVKVKVMQNKNGQYVMKFKGPLDGTKVFVDTAPTLTRSSFQPATQQSLAKDEHFQNGIQATPIGNIIQEKLNPDGKEKTVSVKVPANVPLNAVLKNIYERMYQSYFETRQNQKGRPGIEEEAMKLIDGLVHKDMRNLSSILVNQEQTAKKDKTNSLPDQRSSLHHNAQLDNYLRTMYNNYIQERHNKKKDKGTSLEHHDLSSPHQNDGQLLNYPQQMPNNQKDNSNTVQDQKSSSNQNNNQLETFMRMMYSNQVNNFNWPYIRQQPSFETGYDRSTINTEDPSYQYMYPPTSSYLQEVNTPYQQQPVLNFMGNQYQQQFSGQQLPEQQFPEQQAYQQYPGMGKDEFNPPQAEFASHYSPKPKAFAKSQVGRIQSNYMSHEIHKKGKIQFAKEVTKTAPSINKAPREHEVNVKINKKSQTPTIASSQIKSKPTLIHSSGHIQRSNTQNTGISKFSNNNKNNNNKNNNNKNNNNKNNNNKEMSKMNGESIEIYLNRLKDYKELHDNKNFNQLASKVLPIPLSLFKKKYEEKINFDNKKKLNAKKSAMVNRGGVKGPLMASGPSIISEELAMAKKGNVVAGKVVKRTKTKPGPDAFKTNKVKPAAQSVVKHQYTQYVSADSTHPVVVKDVEGFLKKRQPSFSSYTPQQRKQPGVTKSYYEEHGNQQYYPYPFDNNYYTGMGQWPMNSERDDILPSAYVSPNLPNQFIKDVNPAKKDRMVNNKLTYPESSKYQQNAPNRDTKPGYTNDLPYGMQQSSAVKNPVYRANIPNTDSQNPIQKPTAVRNPDNRVTIPQAPKYTSESNIRLVHQEPFARKPNYRVNVPTKTSLPIKLGPAARNYVSRGGNGGRMKATSHTKSFFESDPFENSLQYKRNSITRANHMKQRLIFLKKRQAIDNELHEDAAHSPTIRRRSAENTTNEMRGFAKTKIIVSPNVIVARSNADDANKIMPTPPTKRSRIPHKKPTGSKRSKKPNKKHGNQTSKRKRQSKKAKKSRQTRKLTAVRSHLPKIDDENKVNAWSLNSSFVENLNENADKRTLITNSRKSEIMHRHKQPKLNQKGKKRITIQHEHEHLTKGIMDSALSMKHEQPSSAASNITARVDNLLRDHTILSDPLVENSTLVNTTIEAFALSPLKEETGASRSNIDEIAFANPTERVNDHVFNDEAMGAKSRAENLAADDVEESLMRSMEVADNESDQRKSTVPGMKLHAQHKHRFVAKMKKSTVPTARSKHSPSVAFNRNNVKRFTVTTKSIYTTGDHPEDLGYRVKAHKKQAFLVNSIHNDLQYQQEEAPVIRNRISVDNRGKAEQLRKGHILNPLSIHSDPFEGIKRDIVFKDSNMRNKTVAMKNTKRSTIPIPEEVPEIFLHDLMATKTNDVMKTKH